MGARAKKTSTKKRKEKRVRKRKMARVKKKKRGMTKFSFVTQPRHFVLHIPNTPPHHHLCSTKKGQIEIDCVSSKSTPIQTREMPDQFPTIHKTTEHPLTKRKKSIPRDGVFSQTKQKRILFSPHLKKKKKKKKKKS